MADETNPTTSEGEQPSARGCVLAIFIALVVVVGGCMALAYSSDGGDRQDEFGAYDACRQVVRRQLASPSSAEFPPPREATIRQDGTDWHVAAWVDADNALGANLRAPWTCTATWVGDGTWTARATVGG